MENGFEVRNSRLVGCGNPLIHESCTGLLRI
jgi:hypothetical protein